ncbi:MAG: HAD family phosphatase [Actinomycetota bacterium]|nr:HAD family phosphatase [Actinomycetota bacterium]
MSPSAIACDFGGVLTSPLVHALDSFADSCGTTLPDLGAAMAAVAERDGEHPLYSLERGEISEAEFMRRTSDELGGGVELSELGEGYFTRLERNEPMLAFLAEMRGRGLRLALCTNNVREWEPLWRPMLPEIDELFEVIVDSGFVGTRKPEPEIYRIVLERLRVEGPDCVFIDDLEINCVAAAEAGMHAVHFRETEQAIAEVRAAVGAVVRR